jgi:cellulose biosynthesis protein BcsQ
MTVVISIVNLKQGAGKTKTAINCGLALSRMGKKTLIIEADAQGNIESYFFKEYFKGLDPMDQAPAPKYDIYNLVGETVEDSEACANNALITEERTAIRQAIAEEAKKSIRQTSYENLSIWPTLINRIDDTRFGFERHIEHLWFIPEMRTRLRTIVSEYDYVLIDMPSNMRGRQDRILESSDYFMIPTELNYLSDIKLGMTCRYMRDFIIDYPDRPQCLKFLGFIAYEEMHTLKTLGEWTPEPIMTMPESKQQTEPKCITTQRGWIKRAEAMAAEWFPNPTGLPYTMCCMGNTNAVDIANAMLGAATCIEEDKQTTIQIFKTIQELVLATLNAGMAELAEAIIERVKSYEALGTVEDSSIVEEAAH